MLKTYMYIICAVYHLCTILCMYIYIYDYIRNHDSNKLQLLQINKNDRARWSLIAQTYGEYPVDVLSTHSRKIYPFNIGNTLSPNISLRTTIKKTLVEYWIYSFEVSWEDYRDGFATLLG